MFDMILLLHFFSKVVILKKTQSFVKLTLDKLGTVS